MSLQVLFLAENVEPRRAKGRTVNKKADWTAGDGRAIVDSGPVLEQTVRLARFVPNEELERVLRLVDEDIEAAMAEVTVMERTGKRGSGWPAMEALLRSKEKVDARVGSFSMLFHDVGKTVEADLNDKEKGRILCAGAALAFPHTRSMQHLAPKIAVGVPEQLEFGRKHEVLAPRCTQPCHVHVWTAHSSFSTDMIRHVAQSTQQVIRVVTETSSSRPYSGYYLGFPDSLVFSLNSVFTREGPLERRDALEAWKKYAEPKIKALLPKGGEAEAPKSQMMLVALAWNEETAHFHKELGGRCMRELGLSPRHSNMLIPAPWACSEEDADEDELEKAMEVLVEQSGIKFDHGDHMRERIRGAIELIGQPSCALTVGEQFESSFLSPLRRRLGGSDDPALLHESFRPSSLLLSHLDDLECSDLRCRLGLSTLSLDFVKTVVKPRAPSLPPRGRRTPKSGYTAAWLPELTGEVRDDGGEGGDGGGGGEGSEGGEGGGDWVGERGIVEELQVLRKELGSKHILFHGTTIEEGTSVACSPQAGVGKNFCDFGRAFYTTARLEEAIDWAEKRARAKGEVNACIAAFGVDGEEEEKEEVGTETDALLRVIESHGLHVSDIREEQDVTSEIVSKFRLGDSDPEDHDHVRGYDVLVGYEVANPGDVVSGEIARLVETDGVLNTQIAFLSLVAGKNNCFFREKCTRRLLLYIDV